MTLVCRAVALSLVVAAAAAHAAFINYSSREINVKIVYFGHETSGLAENLEYIYAKTNPEAKGKLISLATETDRTLFFDFLPLALGEIRGFKTRFHLYTVPGRVEYDASRKLILKGVDGIVFVWDADPKRLVANLDSFRRLRAGLAEQGYDWKATPLVVQVDHHRYPGAVSTQTVGRDLGVDPSRVYVADPGSGAGVFDSLKAIAKLVLLELKKGAPEADAAPATPSPAGQPSAAASGPSGAPPRQQREGCGIYALDGRGGCVADRAKAVAAIRASSLTTAAALEQGLAPTVWLEPVVGPPPGLGASRRFGLPDLPARVEWPTQKGRPLELLAQLRLADVAALDPKLPLPKAGWLSVFCPLSNEDWLIEPDGAACKVLSFDAPVAKLQPRTPTGRPQTSLERGGRALRLRAGFTLPSVELPAAELDAFDELEDAVSNRGRAGLRLLGAPTAVQDDPRLECGGDPAQWSLLLQLDSDEQLAFGDDGSLYFMIRTGDLAARKLDRLCVVSQSY